VLILAVLRSQWLIPAWAEERRPPWYAGVHFLEEKATNRKINFDFGAFAALKA
jgi:hypothetical protein